jgi:cell division septum initiation protein DivIVA
MQRPVINGEVLESGAASWDIFPDQQEEPSSVQEPMDEGTPEQGVPANPVTLSLQRLAISEGRIHYVDHTSGLESSVGAVDMELRGDFSSEQTDLRLILEARGLDAAIQGIRYMRDGVFELELEAMADMVSRNITLKKNVIRLNGLTLEAEGKVSLVGEEAIDLDLHFLTGETSFKTFLSLIPAIYLNDFESLRTEGMFTLEGSIDGTLTDTLLPDMTIALQVTDGSFAYPDLPMDVSDVQISLHAVYKGKDADDSRVDIEKIHFLLGDNPFDLRMSIAHPISDMHVAGLAVGTIDFSNMQDILTLEDISLSGRLESDLKWDTRISAIEEERYDEVDLEGNLLINGFRMEIPELPVPLVLHKAAMEFNPRLVVLKAMDMELGSSDLHMKGQLSNFIPFLFDDKVLYGSLDVTSEYFTTGELIVAEPGEDAEAGQEDSLAVSEDMAEVAPAPSDSLAVPLQFRIPEPIDLNLTLSMEQLLLEQITVGQVEGKLHVSEGRAILDLLKMELLGGTLSLAGVADTRGEFMKVDASIQVEGIDIPAAYAQLNSVERLAPMASYCKGSANVKMQYSSLLDNDFTPLYGSIDATGRVYSKNLQVYNLQSFVKMSELIANEKFREMAPDEVVIDFKIRSGRVLMNPFDIDFDDSKITISGSHGIDHTLDYLLDMSIAKKELGAAANTMLNSMSLMASAAGLQVAQSDHVEVKAYITGTFKEPQVRTDLSGNLGSTKSSVRQSVETKITEELETIEQEVREEAGVQAERIISEAEAEGERLIEQARSAGEQLVREAEIQGDNLIKEAGSNPLKKVAAERAAQELKSQAQKQSERMVKEAEVKAGEIVQKAREEASRL